MPRQRAWRRHHNRVGGERFWPQQRPAAETRPTVAIVSRAGPCWSRVATSWTPSIQMAPQFIQYVMRIDVTRGAHVANLCLR